MFGGCVFALFCLYSYCGGTGLVYRNLDFCGVVVGRGLVPGGGCALGTAAAVRFSRVFGR